MGRAPCCEKVGLKRGRWTAEEDKILANYIAENGGASWRSLPKNAGLLRCGKSCRLRWINYLRTDLKRGNISKEEEETIIKLHASLGNRWSLIADQLPGRTDNEIKNYWNSHLSRRIYSFRRIGGQDMVEAEKLVSAAKRKGGRTSRSAMKKTHMMLSSGGVSSRRENQDTAHLIPTSSSSEQSDGSLDPQQPTSSQCLDGWALCPSEEVFVVDSVFWDGNIEMEAMFEEREDGVVSSSCDVERESRDLKALDEGRDDDQQPLRLKEGGDEVLHSHLEAEACKLWDDQAGEVWPWFWESEIAELEFELLGMDGFVGYQE